MSVYKLLITFHGDGPYEMGVIDNPRKGLNSKVSSTGARIYMMPGPNGADLCHHNVGEVLALFLAWFSFDAELDRGFVQRQMWNREWTDYGRPLTMTLEQAERIAMETLESWGGNIISELVRIKEQQEIVRGSELEVAWHRAMISAARDEGHTNARRRRAVESHGERAAPFTTGLPHGGHRRQVARV